MARAFSGLVAMPLFGWRSLSRSSSCLKRSRSSARSMASGEVPRIGTLACSSGSASLSGVWPPNCTMTPCSVPLRALGVDDLEHVLGGERLEIEPVGGVVVGRHRLRIAVDHDGLVADSLQREGGMAAAIVELDALADAVRPAAEDDDLLLVGRRAPRRRARRRTASRRSNTCRRSARRIRRRRCRCA